MTGFDYNPEAVRVSGTVSISGVVVTSVSGNVVSVASGAHLASGLWLASGITSITSVSGNVVTVASGAYFASGINSVVTIKDNPTTIGSKLRVSVTPYGYDVTEGNISGHTPVFKTGYQIVNNTEIDLWNVTSSYAFATGALQMKVVSDSANDDVGQTGVTKVKIWYLTTGFVEKTEEVTMDGTSGVDTVATDIYRVNAFRVTAAGTGGKAAGKISLTNLSTTTYYSQIAAGQTRARNSIYTVPVSKTLYITQLTYSVGHTTGGRYARFTLRSNYDDKVGTVGTIFYPYHEIGLQDGAISITLDFPLKFPAGADLKISCISDSGSADAICTGSYRGWQE